jgi:hypothetical protein
MVTKRTARKSAQPKRRTNRDGGAKTSPTLDWILSLAKQIPQEEQARHPADGAANKHHYLHGSPKRA